MSLGFLAALSTGLLDVLSAGLLEDLSTGLLDGFVEGLDVRSVRDGGVGLETVVLHHGDNGKKKEKKREAIIRVLNKEE